MTKIKINNFIQKYIKYKDWEFFVGDKNGALYLQVRFDAPDNITGTVESQHCRKYFLSEWMTPTEIVQTCWLAVTRAEMHEAAEQFKFKNCDIFNTHLNVERLTDVCEAGAYEHRGEPKNPNQLTTIIPKPVTVLVSGKTIIRDGGTIRYKDALGYEYFVDHRIGTTTNGAVYDRYPNEDGAKVLDIILKEVK